MSDLSNAKTIGGAVVKITGDIGGLRAAEKEAREITGKIDGLSASVKVVAKNGDLDRLIADVGKAIGKADFVIVPRFDEAALLRQSSRLMEQIQRQWANVVLVPKISLASGGGGGNTLPNNVGSGASLPSGGHGPAGVFSAHGARGGAGGSTGGSGSTLNLPTGASRLPTNYIPEGFRKRDIERKVTAAYHEGGGGYTIEDEKRLSDAAVAGEPFTFHNALPGEIKKFLSDTPAARKLFRVTHGADAGRAGGSDAFGELGDEYFRIAERLAGSDTKSALAAAAKSQDPELRYLADLHANMPKSGSSELRSQIKHLRSKAEATDDPDKRRAIEDRITGIVADGRQSVESLGAYRADTLQAGDSFTVFGRKHTVEEDDRGEPVLMTPEGTSHSLLDLKHVLADAGTMPRRAAGGDSGGGGGSGAVGAAGDDPFDFGGGVPAAAGAGGTLAPASPKLAARREKIADWNARAVAEEGGRQGRTDAAVERFTPRSQNADAIGDAVEQSILGASRNLAAAYKSNAAAQKKAEKAAEDVADAASKAAKTTAVQEKKVAAATLADRLADAPTDARRAMILGEEALKLPAGSAERIRLETRAKGFGRAALEEDASLAEEREKAIADYEGGDIAGGGKRGAFGQWGALKRKVSAGVLAYETLRLAGSGLKYREDSMLASGNLKLQLAAQQEAIGSLESIPLVGQAAGLIAEHDLGLGLVTRATSDSTDANERWADSSFNYARSVRSEKAGQQAALAQSPFDARHAEAKEAFKKRTDKIDDDEKRTQADLLAKERADAISTVTARNQKAADFIGQKHGRLMEYAFKHASAEEFDSQVDMELNRVRSGSDAATIKGIHTEAVGLKDGAATVLSRDDRVIEGDREYGVAVAKAETGSAGLRGESADAMGRRDSLAAFDKQRAADRKESLGKLDASIDRAQIDNKDLYNQLRSQREAQFGRQNADGSFDGSGSTDKQTAAERKLLTENIAAENASSTAQTLANKQRAQHQVFAPQRTVLTDQLEKAKKIDDVATRDATVGRIQSDIDLLGSQQSDHRADVSADADTAEAVERLRGNRDFFGASMKQRKTEQGKVLERTSDDDKENRRREFDADNRTLVAEHTFAVDQSKGDMAAERTAGGQFRSGQFERAAQTTRTRATLDRVANAESDLREATRLTAISDLETDRSRLTGQHGGAIVSGTDLGGAQHAILESRQTRRREAGTAKDINNAIAGLRGGPGAVAAAPGGRNGPVAGRNPAGNNAANGNGPTARQMSDMQNDVKTLVKILAAQNRAGNPAIAFGP